MDIEISDNRGQFKAGIHLKDNPILGFEAIDDMHVIAVLGLEYRDDNPRVMRAVCRVGSRGEIKRLSREYYRYALENTGTGWIAKETGFDPDLYLSKIDKASYIYGYSEEYELSVIDQDGKVLYRIRREWAEARIHNGGESGL